MAEEQIKIRIQADADQFKAVSAAVEKALADIGKQADITAGKWTLFIAYSATTLPSAPGSPAGTALTYAGDGVTLSWLSPTASTNNLYVGPGGVDGDDCRQTRDRAVTVADDHVVVARVRRGSTRHRVRGARGPGDE